MTVSGGWKNVKLSQNSMQGPCWKVHNFYKAWYISSPLFYKILYLFKEKTAHAWNVSHVTNLIHFVKIIFRSLWLTFCQTDTVFQNPVVLSVVTFDINVVYFMGVFCHLGGHCEKCLDTGQKTLQYAHGDQCYLFRTIHAHLNVSPFILNNILETIGTSYDGTWSWQDSHWYNVIMSAGRISALSTFDSYYYL